MRYETVQVPSTAEVLILMLYHVRMRYETVQVPSTAEVLILMLCHVRMRYETACFYAEYSCSSFFSVNLRILKITFLTAPIDHELLLPLIMIR
jgi:hypothetical protein